MRSKPPSSLDYYGHLHELALRNWRRALRDRDVARAEINARTLTRSHDKFWRFVGYVHLALAHLGAGRTASALDAFAGAAGAYPDARPLISIARAQCAHVHLETGSPQLALDSLADEAATGEIRYWRALANARMSNQGVARELADGVDDALLHAHVLVELGEDPERLRTAIELEPNEVLASPRAVVPCAFALALRLEDQNRASDAETLYARIVDASEALAHWPLPYVRALYRCGMYVEFVELWGEGDVDREAIAKARQFVKS